MQGHEGGKGCTAPPEQLQPNPAREPNLREQAAHLIASMEIAQVRPPGCVNHVYG